MKVGEPCFCHSFELLGVQFKVLCEISFASTLGQSFDNEIISYLQSINARIVIIKFTLHGL